jgi:hypothetical protein
MLVRATSYVSFRDVLNFTVISISSDVKISLCEMSDIPASHENRLPYYDTSELFVEFTDFSGC